MLFKNIKHKKTKTDCKVAGQVAFWINNGPVVASLGELLESIKNMSEHQFNFHTQRAGNDFANWIKHIIKDGMLARKILNAKSREKTIRILSDHINNYYL